MECVDPAEHRSSRESEVQKRAVGMMSNLKGSTYEEKLQELELTALEERRHQVDMLQVFKNTHRIRHTESEHWLEMAAMAPVRTRHAAGLMNIMKPGARLDVTAVLIKEPELEPNYKVWAPQHWM